jgi:hypothetical protein
MPLPTPQKHVHLLTKQIIRNGPHIRVHQRFCQNGTLLRSPANALLVVVAGIFVGFDGVGGGGGAAVRLKVVELRKALSSVMLGLDPM